MKKLIVLGLLSFSAQAFSQTCYVDMIVKNTNRVVRSFTAVGEPTTCMEGMKECRKSIRFDYSTNVQYPSASLDCVVANYSTPVPAPTNPYPTPGYPQPSRQYPTNIIIGETVFNVSNNRYAEVMGVDYQGKYMLRFLDNGLTGTGWSRANLAPARGCDGDICVNDNVFNTSNNRYAKVVGLQMGNKFVLKFTDNSLTGSGWSRTNIAVMQGCQGDLCVGDKVYNTSNNRHARIDGLQEGGKFVLRFEDNGLSGSGWSRTNIAVKVGCQLGLCVGSRVFNSSNNRYARIEALQEGGKFVLRFDDNGLTGSGWSASNLIVVR